MSDRPFCKCGHTDSRHIYLEGACRPGFKCECPKYDPVKEAVEMDRTNLVLDEVFMERCRQEAKWGEQDHEPEEWLMILGEEVGEVNRAALERYFHYQNKSEAEHKANYRAELVQVAAVAVAMIENFDRSERETESV